MYVAFGVTMTSSHTAVGLVMGTAGYMAPEQVRGDPVGPATDIYGVGVVLYEMVVGHPPFSGDSPVSIAYQHVREAPVAPSRLIVSDTIDRLGHLPPWLQERTEVVPTVEMVAEAIRRIHKGSGSISDLLT